MLIEKLATLWQYKQVCYVTIRKACFWPRRKRSRKVIPLMSCWSLTRLKIANYVRRIWSSDRYSSDFLWYTFKAAVNKRDSSSSPWKLILTFHFKRCKNLFKTLKDVKLFLIMKHVFRNRHEIQHNRKGWDLRERWQLTNLEKFKIVVLRFAFSNVSRGDVHLIEWILNPSESRRRLAQSD